MANLGRMKKAKRDEWNAKNWAEPENTGAGKGDKRRPSFIPADKYRENYDRIFGRKD